MKDGFLGYQSTFMLDAVVLALLLVLPVLAYSIYLVKVKQDYATHKMLQLGLAVVLLLAVTAFEVDVQILNKGWENIVGKRELSADRWNEVRLWLRIHLFFAVTTPVLWIITLVLALKRFPKPVQPSEHSKLHKTLGWLSALDLTLTSVTGWIFYYMAFIK